MKKSDPKAIIVSDPSLSETATELVKIEEAEQQERSMIKMLVDTVDEQKYKSPAAPKGYDYDPNNPKAYFGLWRRRDNLIPYYIVKQLAENDDLLAVILTTRGNQLSQFGHIQTDRHSIGYKLSYRDDKVKSLTPEKRAELNKRVVEIRNLMYTCGHTAGLKNFEQKTLPQFLKEVARAAMLVGFAPVEIVRDRAGKFHHFKTLDWGTVYKAPLVNRNDAKQIQQLQQAMGELAAHNQSEANRTNVDLSRLQYQKFTEGFYSWVQVVNSLPVQAFTDDELIVHNYSIANEMQWDSYPFSPLEGVVKDITAHINANTHNFNYFKNGRAARGFLTIQSDDITENELQRIRLQFYNSINGSANSWRMPLFGVGQEDKITFQPFDTGTRDQEFVYLSDNLARIVLSAFGVDPAELPGFGHLAKGTFSQALSESGNEYSLQISRSAGFKPLLWSTQILMNQILAIIDPEVASYCIMEFVGLDVDDPAKETARIQSEMNIWLNYSQVLRMVEQDEVPIGGNWPLNPNFVNVIREHYNEGVMQYAFSGNKDALYDPTLAYLNSGFYFQYLSLFPELLKSKDRVAATLKLFTRQILDKMKKS